MVVDVFEDIDPASPEFIKKKAFPFSRQKFFQQDVTRGQVGGNNDLPQLIDFRGQGFQLHRLLLLKKRSMGWDGNAEALPPSIFGLSLNPFQKLPPFLNRKNRLKVILNNKNSSRSSA
jgi:hypothetical protein